MKYQLDTAEQATLDSLREKGAFGLEWHAGRKHWTQRLCYYNDELQYEGCRHIELTDEAAFALMVRRGLKELGAKWKLDWYNTVGRVALDARLKQIDGNVPIDILSAVLAALKETK